MQVPPSTVARSPARSLESAQAQRPQRSATVPQGSRFANHALGTRPIVSALATGGRTLEYVRAHGKPHLSLSIGSPAPESTPFLSAIPIANRKPIFLLDTLPSPPRAECKANFHRCVRSRRQLSTGHRSKPLRVSFSSPLLGGASPVPHGDVAVPSRVRQESRLITVAPYKLKVRGYRVETRSPLKRGRFASPPVSRCRFARVPIYTALFG